MLVRVVAPHFVAGIVLNDRECVTEAAPILAWTVGGRRDELRLYFQRKKWKASICEIASRETPK